MGINRKFWRQRRFWAALITIGAVVFAYDVAPAQVEAIAAAIASILGE